MGFYDTLLRKLTDAGIVPDQGYDTAREILVSLPRIGVEAVEFRHPTLGTQIGAGNCCLNLGTGPEKLCVSVVQSYLTLQLAR